MSATTIGPRPSPALFLPYEEGGTGRPATKNDRNRVFSLPGRISSVSPLGVEESSLRLGVPALDAALQGGLAAGALHELAPASELQLGAAFGFALALAGLAAAKGQVLCITTEFAAREGGAPYGVGLDLFGLSLERLLILRVAHPRDALWGFEEGLKCRALAAVLAELPEEGEAADFTATRRLALAAQAGGGLGLLLRHRRYPLPSAAMTRWQVAAAASAPDRFGGLGGTRFDLTLERNRHGRCGRFIADWNHDERTFVPQALSLGVAATARDRSDRAHRRRTA
jgi:protein ImuA